MSKPILIWFRRDLRLSDHEALSWAAAQKRPIIPVWICDEIIEDLGAAPKWRMGLGVDAFQKALEAIGSRLILRKGDALGVLLTLITETGADTVIWSRAYDPDTIARDRSVKAAVVEQGITAQSFTGHLLYDPWKPQTKTGGFYKVYTPFWRYVSSSMDVAAPLPSVSTLPAPENWPESESLSDWGLGAEMRRGAAIVASHVHVGEQAAQDRLSAFVERNIGNYKEHRDFPSLNATSGLSENLTYGEISPRQMYHAGHMAMEAGAAGAEHFLKEITWREFAYHLLWNFPDLATREWRPEWEGFPWTVDAALVWKQGRTGEAFVDAAMRELYVTGIMHNRARMIVGSYLTKNMLINWRVGLKWFEDCLIDWDPASNAMGWQWIAGCGPDAAPYFRIFNPTTQAEKFDPEHSYRTRFLDPSKSSDAAAFYEACPRSWKLDSNERIKAPEVPISHTRKDALLAYEKFRNRGS